MEKKELENKEKINKLYEHPEWTLLKVSIEEMMGHLNMIGLNYLNSLGYDYTPEELMPMTLDALRETFTGAK